VINNIGICYYQSGSYQKSIVFFKKAIVLNATNPESKFNMGITYYKLNDFDTASLDIKTASAIWDTCYGDSCHGYFLDAIYYLGMCYKKAGELSAAKKHFELLQKEGYPRDLTPEDQAHQLRTLPLTQLVLSGSSARMIDRPQCGWSDGIKKKVEQWLYCLLSSRALCVSCSFLSFREYISSRITGNISNVNIVSVMRPPIMTRASGR
jgi:tetratricopeptide (TPR) repeat protein